jgi:hypothetical protein
VENDVSGAGGGGLLPLDDRQQAARLELVGRGGCSTAAAVQPQFGRWDGEQSGGKEEPV